MALLLIIFGLCLLYWALSQDNDNSEPTQDKTSTNDDNEKINLFKYFLKIIFICLFFHNPSPSFYGCVKYCFHRHYYLFNI